MVSCFLLNWRMKYICVIKRTQAHFEWVARVLTHFFLQNSSETVAVVQKAAFAVVRRCIGAHVVELEEVVLFARCLCSRRSFLRSGCRCRLLLICFRCRRRRACIRVGLLLWHTGDLPRAGRCPLVSSLRLRLQVARSRPSGYRQSQQSARHYWEDSRCRHSRFWSARLWEKYSAL